MQCFPKVVVGFQATHALSTLDPWIFISRYVKQIMYSVQHLKQRVRVVETSATLSVSSPVW
jgi:hypothetical protein